MKTIGLTGGIACGKSSVAALLKERGIPIIDADQVARDIVQPGTPGLREIVKAFGEEMKHEDGTLNRKALGALVMHSEEKRQQLNAITHPKIRLSIAKMLQQNRQAGHPFSVVEAALMVETGSHTLYDALIVVTCSPTVQQQRLMIREGFDIETAAKWIASQMPLSEKEAHADILINNSGTKEALRKQVEQGWEKLRRLISGASINSVR